MSEVKAKVAISSDFLNAFAALPRNVQGKVTEFINKFRNDPTSPGIHYEKLNCSDKKIWSVRIDFTYRGIVVKDTESGVYLLLWVDHHDEAYAWAKNKRCEVNKATGAIQVYDMVTISEAVPGPESNTLFADVSDEQLISLGVPTEQLLFVRSISDKNEFLSKENAFSHDCFESLSWVVEGFPVNEVLDLIANEKQESENLAEALGSPETLKSFVVVEEEDELRRIMAEPLEKWRVFLHPTQRKIVNKHYSGAARVLGGAGTGKTVVAMHRAKHLAAATQGKERILFTTFTANLAADIKENLRKICTVEESRKIDVINLDAWVAQYLREQGYSANIIYGKDLQSLWEEAAVLDDSFPVNFYMEEWDRVVAAQEAFTMEKYMRAARTGRGTRLNRKMRVQVWKVFENYQNLMKQKQIRDINTAMYECRLLVEKAPSSSRYKHIIVDEGQDLSANAFRLLRSIAGDEHPDDIFIVGDAHQRIYKNKAVLSKCGINIRGRSSILRVNYRTTEEIRRSAFALLNGISFDDLDDSFDDGDRCRSLTHGSAPKIYTCGNANEEFEILTTEIKKLIDNGVSNKDICVVARTRKLVDDYTEQLNSKGLRCFEIKRSKVDDRSVDGIRVATMHRIKGLEFQYVFVVAVNDHVVPLTSAIDKTDFTSEEESITAEKCLLYVAITRAQKGVYLMSYGRKSEFI